MDPQPQDPLATLAASLTPEAYQALEAILTGFNNRIAAAEQATEVPVQPIPPILTPADIRTAIEQGFASAHFEIPQMSAPSTSTSRTGQLKVELAPYHGKDSEDLGAWLILIEDYLTGQHIPNSDWPLQVPMLFRGEAMRWYVAKKKALGRTFTWPELRRAMEEKFDMKLRIETLRNNLCTVPWKGNLTRYAAAFREIESQIPEEDMTFGDRLANFLDGIPVEHAKDIRRDKPTTTEEIYHSARELERLSSLHRSSVSQEESTSHLTSPWILFILPFTLLLNSGTFDFYDSQQGPCSYGP
ncbi:hypothetical protein CERSUDRAFT_70723 [Gelatoporia subvermispora B]|uniref:Retrotransposon gag domain-containing protein n=1 Tax=Ceriporiopsis subvermispora (strain B) TaxID=914234 RepID=M2RPE4_CERS8|nr:hypothetical protein CERSUDRAFT_70723 [Gelatoporia subvermispora B]